MLRGKLSSCSVVVDILVLCFIFQFSVFHQAFALVSFLLTAMYTHAQIFSETFTYAIFCFCNFPATPMCMYACIIVVVISYMLKCCSLSFTYSKFYIHKFYE